MNEKLVSIEHDGVTLEGTLSRPDGDGMAMCVLLIAGSGPLDRNQNSARVQLNLFNSIAAKLCEKGIASVRYDKRGCGKSTGDFDATGHTELVGDAARWLSWMQQLSSLKETSFYLLGHGEGALIAAQLAASNPTIDGQILISPSVENYARVIQRQAEVALQEISTLRGFKGGLLRFFLRLSGNQIAKQKKLVKRIQQSSGATIKIRKQLINAKWIREMIALDGPAIFAETTVPTLAIGGAKDLQSLPADVDTLKTLIRAPLEAHVLPDLTHVLRADEGVASTQHYTRLSLQPVDDRLHEIIGRWLIDRGQGNA
ncbi:MAG: alpha/beta hydrolase [Granulosicoccus sp.]|nr:alpha/beta hydrolase [Granulosicoccus sp.]